MIQDCPAFQSQHLVIKGFETDMMNAYHQAGLAASIYLSNKQKKLPAVFFRIILKEPHHALDENRCLMPSSRKYAAKLEGGRLIQGWPLSFAEAAGNFSDTQQQQFRYAFEADVINLLAGFLAEAKYAAKEGDEDLGLHFFDMEVLHDFGASPEMEFITHYLDCFTPLKDERERKMDELLLSAYAFVNHQHNWQAITMLANYISDYILDESKAIISCEEVMALVESCIPTKL